MNIETLIRSEELMAELANLAKERGVKALAAQAGVSRGYLYAVLRGTRLPGPALLSYLGVERHPMKAIYRKQVSK